MLCRCGCGEILKNQSSKTQTNRGHHHRLPEIKRKKKESCLKKYGVDNPSQIYNIKIKKKKTCLKNYGVENPNQSKIIQDKSKETCKEKYGVLSYSQTDDFKIKYKKTCLERFGVDNIFKSKKTIHNIQKKRQLTCIEKYGVDNYAKTPEFRRLARKNILIQIANQKNNGMPIYPLIGRNEKDFLDELQKHCKYNIIRQYPVIGYFVDGYIKELNIVIELDEKWHDILKWYKEHDPIRENDIHEYIDCIFFRVKEEDWLNDKSKIINKFEEELSKCTI